MKKLIFFSYIILLILSGCGSLPEPGEKVFLKESGMAAISETDYKEMTNKGSSEDLVGLQQMVNSGKVFVLPVDMQGVLIEKGMDRAQIEVDINGRKEKVWIARETLR